MSALFRWRSLTSPAKLLISQAGTKKIADRSFADTYQPDVLENIAWHGRASFFFTTMYIHRVIYSLATKGRRMLSFTLSGEWCSVLPLVFAQALVSFNV
jgi:hypothetical protein